MWAKKSQVTKVKENPGTRASSRTDLYDVIRGAVKTDRLTRAIISFAASLLPFFKPNKDTVNCVFATSQMMSYQPILVSNPVFQPMALFLQRIGFDFKSELVPHVEKLSESFMENNDPLAINNDPGFNSVLSSLSGWKPIRMGKEDHDRLIHKLEQQILVEYARGASEPFRVC